MRFLSFICFIFLIDAILGLVQGHNMWTLKPGGFAINLVSLVVLLFVGPALHRAGREPI